MIPLYIREMAEDRAAGLSWREVTERYGYGSVKAAQNALYKAARRDPSLRRAVRRHEPTKPAQRQRAVDPRAAARAAEARYYARMRADGWRKVQGQWVRESA